MAQVIGRCANVGAHGLTNQLGLVLGAAGRQQCFHSRTDAVDDRPEVGRLRGHAADLLQRRKDRAALSVAQHHDQR